MKILTILGSKGGVGKSTIASNLLVAARLAGLDAVGLDLDPQGSLAAWSADRAIEPVSPVSTGPLTSWRELVQGEGALAVVDTPPGLPDEDTRVSMGRLATASRLVLIPALPEEPTLRMLGPVGSGLAALGAPVLFVLNKVDARKRATRGARAYLGRHGEVCEVEIPAREHIHQAMAGGMAVVEDERFGGSGAMRDLWRVAADRLGLA